MPDYHIVQEEIPDPDTIKMIGERLREYNVNQVGYSDFKRLAFFIRDAEDQIVGGIVGVTYWDWFAIDLLWIHEKLRSQGYGSLLLRAAEKEALARGCKQVLLDTFSFQAPEFYRKHGYEQYGVLDGFAGQYQRLYYRKKLQAE